MKKQSKGYETPVQGWSEDRIRNESDIQQDYGLVNKKEVWKAQSRVRDFRRQARRLNAEENEDMEEDLLEKLVSLGILNEGAELNDVLDIDIEDVLERRLQTVVYRRGLADTMRKARQLVGHGHIMVGGRKVDVPGYLVTEEEETEIKVAPGSEQIVE
ncbi:MAG: 30S ribosomal protein S4 [Candidatus Nanohaloarchaeota archaeon QJJ-7]|nr:30S ribosomal protein S4 [Candidatus Nanohaloarchaeota archaeon QJJ-7]